METEKSISDIFEEINSIVGDTPVSEQLGAALNRMASKQHEHDNYVSREEFDALEKRMQALELMVGDMSVADQINIAINGYIK